MTTTTEREIKISVGRGAGRALVFRGERNIHAKFFFDGQLDRAVDQHQFTLTGVKGVKAVKYGVIIGHAVEVGVPKGRVGTEKIFFAVGQSVVVRVGVVDGLVAVFVVEAAAR